MEDVLFGIAVAMFVISAVSAIASVVVFKKLEVADAIRFLRHRTTASGVGLVGVLAHKPKQRKAKGEDLERDTAPSIARKKGKHEREESSDGQGASSKLAASVSLSKKGSDELQGDSSSEGAKRQAKASSAGEAALGGSSAARKVASDSATTILTDADSPVTGSETADSENLGSERPTDLLVEKSVGEACSDDGASEHPTELLVGEEGFDEAFDGSEHPTELLAERAPAAPPVIPSAQLICWFAQMRKARPMTPMPTASANPSSERPTEMLACGDSESPTEILSFAGSGNGDSMEQAVADVGSEENAPDSERPTEMLSPSAILSGKRLVSNRRLAVPLPPRRRRRNRFSGSA